MDTITRFMDALERSMDEHAKASMLRPKRKLFAQGEASGVYQGLNKAKEILDDILRDNEEKEDRS